MNAATVLGPIQPFTDEEASAWQTYARVRLTMHVHKRLLDSAFTNVCYEGRIEQRKIHFRYERLPRNCVCYLIGHAIDDCPTRKGVLTKLENPLLCSTKRAELDSLLHQLLLPGLKVLSYATRRNFNGGGPSSPVSSTNTNGTPTSKGNNCNEGYTHFPPIVPVTEGGDVSAFFLKDPISGMIQVGKTSTPKYYMPTPAMPLFLLLLSPIFTQTLQLVPIQTPPLLLLQASGLVYVITMNVGEMRILFRFPDLPIFLRRLIN